LASPVRPQLFTAPTHPYASETARRIPSGRPRQPWGIPALGRGAVRGEALSDGGSAKLTPELIEILRALDPRDVPDRYRQKLAELEAARQKLIRLHEAGRISAEELPTGVLEAQFARTASYY
jgi:hypothetical protein